MSSRMKPITLTFCVLMSTISELSGTAISNTGTNESTTDAKSTLKQMPFHYGIINAFEGICFGFSP